MNWHPQPYWTFNTCKILAIPNEAQKTVLSILLLLQTMFRILLIEALNVYKEKSLSVCQMITPLDFLHRILAMDVVADVLILKNESQ